MRECVAQVLLLFAGEKSDNTLCGRREERGLVSPGTARCKYRFMTADTLIHLLEEMMDIKIQQYAQYHLKLNPEVAKLLQEKRETDRRRLDQIRLELVRFLDS